MEFSETVTPFWLEFVLERQQKVREHQDVWELLAIAVDKVSWGVSQKVGEEKTALLVRPVKGTPTYRYSKRYFKVNLTFHILGRW